MTSTTGNRFGHAAGLAPIRAALLVAALPLGLAACGGGDGTSGKSAAGTPPPATTADTSGLTAGLTPPGTQLGFGQKATVGWVPPSFDSGSEAKQAFKLEITVEKIEKGTIADFKNVQLKENERTSTPYYVKVHIKALDTRSPTGTYDPDVTLDAIDDRGQKQGGINFLGTFSRCDDKTPPKPFAKGKSYNSCLAYLMPGGGSIQKVSWNNGPSQAREVTPYFTKPIVWAAG